MSEITISPVYIGYYCLDPNESIKILSNVLRISINKHDEDSFMYLIELLNSQEFEKPMQMRYPTDYSLNFLDDIAYVTNFIEEVAKITEQFYPEDFNRYLGKFFEVCIESIDAYRVMFININNTGDVLIGRMTEKEYPYMVLASIERELFRRFPNADNDQLDQKTTLVYNEIKKSLRHVH